MSSHTISVQDEETSLGGRLQSLHDTIIERLPGISRIAVALYDSETDLLKTFKRTSLMLSLVSVPIKRLGPQRMRSTSSTIWRRKASWTQTAYKRYGTTRKRY